MSVIIEGMKNPDRCSACQMLEGHRDDGMCHAANRWLDDDDYWTWYVYPEGDVDTSKPVNCPLIPLPNKHGRLISADEAYDRIMEQEGGYYIDMDGVGMGLDECKTIVESEGD